MKISLIILIFILMSLSAQASCYYNIRCASFNTQRIAFGYECGLFDSCEKYEAANEELAELPDEVHLTRIYKDDQGRIQKRSDLIGEVRGKSQFMSGATLDDIQDEIKQRKNEHQKIYDNCQKALKQKKTTFGMCSKPAISEQ